MKNKLNKIILIISSILIISILLLTILGSVNRKGYLSDFTLQSSSNGEYTYSFRIKYYTKIFRNSDIYKVYFDTNEIIQNNNFIKNIKIDKQGSPFGTLVSSKQLVYDEKIDNINYFLRIKTVYYIILFVLILFNMYLYIYRSLISNLYNRILENKNIIFKISSIIFFSLIGVFLLLFLLGSIPHKGYLSDFELIAESKAGYVYKAKINSKGLFSPNLIYEYSDKPLKLENKPDYIKNYGYSIEINRIPDWYDKNDKNIIYSNKINEFSIYNPYDYNWNSYNNTIKVSVGEKYNITAEMKGNVAKSSYHKLIFIGLDDYNREIPIFSTNNINAYDKELSDSKYMPYSNHIEIYDMPNTKDDHNLNIMFPNNSKLDIKYIKIEQVGDLYIKDNQYIVFTTDRKIDDFVNIYYNLSINNYIIVIFLILLFLCLIFLLNRISLNNFQFSILSFVLVSFLAIFHYWLCYPGIFHNWDVWWSMKDGVSGYYSNWHPALISFVLNILYKIFGYNTHYLFTINILLFYTGLYILIVSIYYKLKNIFVLILLLIPFISHLFFVGIINHIKDFGSTNNIWLSYIIIFYWCVSDIKSKKINFLIIFLFSLFLIMGMLWRHNFIVLVYPMFILFTYKILKIFNIKSKVKYLLSFIVIMSVSAILLVSIYTSFPIIINAINGNKYRGSIADNSIKLLQIASCAVPNNDDSMIPQEWYMEGKTFEDLKNTFNKNPFVADIFFFIQQDIDPFYDKQLKDLSKVMIKYILKYPLTYIKYKYEYLKLCWNVPSYEKINVYYVQYHLFKDSCSKEQYLHGYFDNNASGITFNDLRGKIYSNLYKLIPEIPILYYIMLSIIIFIISSVLLIFKTDFINNILIFTFCVSFSALAINAIVVLYSPVALYRYMYPIIPLSIISLISFITFIYDRCGIKKFIQELRGKK